MELLLFTIKNNVAMGIYIYISFCVDVLHHFILVLRHPSEERVCVRTCVRTRGPWIFVVRTNGGVEEHMEGTATVTPAWHSVWTFDPPHSCRVKTRPWDLGLPWDWATRWQGWLTAGHTVRQLVPQGGAAPSCQA